MVRCRMTIAESTLRIGICCAAVLTIVGCKEEFPQTVVVRGTVFYQGKPVPKGTITFHPLHGEGELYRPAVGVIASDGTYQLQSFRRGDGIMPGDYVVVIESYEGGPTAEETNRPRKWLIPEKFGNPSISGLRATIPTDARQPLVFDFQLQ